MDCSWQRGSNNIQGRKNQVLSLRRDALSLMFPLAAERPVEHTQVQLIILNKSEALTILTDLYLTISHKSLSPLTMNSADAARAQAMNLSSSGSLQTPLTLLVTFTTSKKGSTSSSRIVLISSFVSLNFGYSSTPLNSS